MTCFWGNSNLLHISRSSVPAAPQLVWQDGCACSLLAKKAAAKGINYLKHAVLFYHLFFSCFVSSLLKALPIRHTYCCHWCCCCWCCCRCHWSSCRSLHLGNHSHHSTYCSSAIPEGSAGSFPVTTGSFHGSLRHLRTQQWPQDAATLFVFP